MELQKDRDNERELARRHRLKCKFSLREVAGILGMHWTTYRNWEAGILEECPDEIFDRIHDFSSGEYDDILALLKSISFHSEELTLWDSRFAETAVGVLKKIAEARCDVKAMNKMQNEMERIFTQVFSDYCKDI